jgi:hypothetical protein
VIVSRKIFLQALQVACRGAFGLRNGFVTLILVNQLCRRNPRLSCHNFKPFGECSGAGLAKNSAGDQMALQIEVIVDGIVNRQKSLH